MPREIITVQVGQCGNQMGLKFWELILQEHSKYNKDSSYNEALSVFFKNIDPSKKKNQIIHVDNGKNQINQLKARAILVDTEEGVTNQILKHEIGEIFDQKQMINDVSGAGNNWAHGNHFYGPKYQEDILEKIRKVAEECDSLQSFFVLHSLGGGTGSGLGTYIIQLLQDYYPDVFKFTASVFPSKDDDVVTSPYNSLLSLNELYKHADCVLPISNQALLNICNLSEAKKFNNNSNEQQIKGSHLTETGKQEKNFKAFDKMNNVIAHLLSNLTWQSRFSIVSSMRFEGQLNIDLNEITMNLVPFPKQHFLLSSIAPQYSLSDIKMQPRRIDQIFQDAYNKDFQLICANPLQHRYTAMGLIVRGNVSFSDVNRNIKKLKDDLNMIYWNTEGFKYGICNAPPISQPYSLLCLANNTAIVEPFQEIIDKFMKLYKRKVYTHHYTQYMPMENFDQAYDNITSLIQSYQELEIVQRPEYIPRIQPII